MQLSSPTRYLALAAMFIAAGVLLPIVFHAVNLGSFLLPLFWPVAMAAVFLPAFFALMVGILTPILSMAFTGMPPVPIIYVILIQLFILTFVVRLFYIRTKLGVFWVLLAGLAVSLLIRFVAVIPLAGLLGLPRHIVSVVATLRGVPGVLAMLLVLPFLINKINHQPVFKNRT
jgi:hypothetical protein